MVYLQLNGLEPALQETGSLGGLLIFIWVASIFCISLTATFSFIGNECLETKSLLLRIIQFRKQSLRYIKAT